MSEKNLTPKNWTSWHHLLHKELLSNKKLIDFNEAYNGIKKHKEKKIL